MAKPNDTSFSISIHALREEGDGPAGGTAYHHRISIHALREEGDQKDPFGDSIMVISIHALREEGDYVPGSPPAGARRFLSTPSARRATRPLAQPGQRSGISIHALREEGDV